MANYNLVVNSTFQPFSYERYIKPYEEYEKAYLAQEALNDALSEASSKWEEQIDETVDKELYDRVVQYNTDLKKQAEDLSKYGLSPNRRKDLMALKRRYDRDIDPINTAFTRREALAKEQREGLRVNDSLLYDTDFGTVSLQYMMDNPNATYTILNGNNIAARTAAMAKEAAAAIVSDPEFTPVYGGQYVQQKIQQGYTMEQVLAAAANDPNAPEALLDIIETIKKQVGYDNWKGDKSRIDHYINEGLHAAVGDPQISIVADRSYVSPQDRATRALQNEQIRLQNERIRRETEGIPTADGGRIVPLGGNNFIKYDKDGNVVSENLPLSSQERAAAAEVEQQYKEDLALQTSLTKANSLSEIKKLGFSPVGIVAKTGGNWHAGKEGDDAPGVLFGSTRSQVVTNWGNFTYTPDNGASMYLVTNMETIPGFSSAYMTGQGNVTSSTAFGKIVEAAHKAGISDAEFRSGNVQIFQVKAEKGRAGGDYDYIIFRKN